MKKALYLISFLTITLSLGCGSDSCDPLILDPTGTWRGTLTKTSDTCTSEVNPQQLNLRHEIFSDCNGGEQDLKMFDQDGVFFVETEHSSFFTLEFDLESEEIIYANNRREFRKAEYTDATGGDAKVELKIRRDGAGLPHCEIKYHGELDQD